MADKRIYIGENSNVNATPTWYEITSWVDSLPTETNAQSEGQPPTMTITVYSEIPGIGNLPVQPVGGMEIIFYTHNSSNPLLHTYHFAGKLNTVEESATIEDKVYVLSCEGFERELNTHVPYIAFDPDYFPDDSTRINELFSTADLPVSWDGSTYVGGPFVNYDGTPVQVFSRKTVYDILTAIATDPGPVNGTDYPVPYRRTRVHGEWSDPFNPGTTGSTIIRYLNYYSGSTLAREVIPLSDDSTTSYQNYVADSFTRSNSAAIMGNSDTGQSWSGVNGTWGIDSNRAYLAIGAAGDYLGAITSFSTTGNVKATIATKQSGAGIAVRTAGSGSSWSGFFLANNSNTQYRFRKRTGGVNTTITTIAVVPADGDVLQILMVGNVLTPYVNGLAYAGTTDTMNNTSTAHGLYATGTGVARWDDFSVSGTPALYYDWNRTLDYTGMVNIIAVAGPGSDPFNVEWNDASKVKVEADAGRIKKSATTSSWDAGAISSQTFGSDGGYVSTTIEDTVLASDTFSRTDATQLDQSEVGGAWTQLTGTAGVVNNQAYPITFDGSSDSIAVLTTLSNVCVVQANIATYASGIGLVFRATDKNNLFLLAAEPTRYALYKRVAGTPTLLGNSLLTPANGDEMKVSIEDNTFKVYRNNSLLFSVTDSFNSTAVMHGIRFNSSTSQRIDDFKVRIPYAAKAFGIGRTNSSESYTDIEYAIRLNADRTGQVYESGVAKGSPFSYVIGDSFKVEMRPYIEEGMPSIAYRVKYFKVPVYGGPTELFTSLSHPDPVTDTYFVDTSIYTPGAVISNLNTRYFSYGVYSDQESVSEYGYFWAKEILVDETLDTDDKRQARADAIFARYAYPRDTFTCTTLQEYKAGRIVLVNNTRLGWVDQQRVIAEVGINYSENDNLDVPLYELTLGDRPVEYGDEEPIGFLIRANDQDNDDPSIPLGLAAGTGYRDGAQTIAQPFTWERPSRDEQTIELALNPANNPGQSQIYSFPARQAKGTVPGLLYSTLYVARIRARDYNNNVSGWSSPIEFTTIQIPRIDPPTWAGSPFPQDGIRGDIAWTKVDWVAPAAPASAMPGYYDLQFKLTGELQWFDFIRVPATQTDTIVDNLTPDVSYTYRVRSVDSYGVEGNWSTTQAHTVSIVTLGLYNPDFEIVSRFDTTLPEGWTFTLVGTGSTAALSISNPGHGLRSLGMTVTTADVAGSTYYVKATSRAFILQPGTPYFISVMARNAVSSDNFTFGIDYYQADGTFISSPTILSTRTVNTSWTTITYGGAIPPANTAYGKIWISNRYGSVATTLYVDNVIFRGQIEPDEYKDASITGAKLNSSLSYSGLLTLTGNPLKVTNPIPLNSSIQTSDPTSSSGDLWVQTSGSFRRVRVKDGSTIYDLGNSALQAGTAFPGSPITGQGFYRTDLGVYCYYDGTRWLGPMISQSLIGSANSGGVPATYTGTTLIGRFAPISPHLYWIVSVTWSFYVATTNNGSNYWTFRYGVENTGGGGGVVCDINTSSGITAGSRYAREMTTFTGNPLDFSSSSAFDVFLEVRKDTGSPGTLNLYGVNALARRVYT